jgi:hypothetical protein
MDDDLNILENRIRPQDFGNGGQPQQMEHNLMILEMEDNIKF